MAIAVTEKSLLRLRFEAEAFPHLEALWRTAMWLTLAREAADRLVVNTMKQAYRTWDSPESPLSSSVRLFRILVRQFFEHVTGWDQPVGFLDENGDADSTTNEDGRPSATIPLDSLGLDKLRVTSDAVVRHTVVRFRVQSRLVALLLFRERFSYSDIAYITDLRYESVKAMLCRLRKVIPRFLLQPHVCQVTAIDGFTAARTLRASSDGNDMENDAYA